MTTKARKREEKGENTVQGIQIPNHIKSQPLTIVYLADIVTLDRLNGIGCKFNQFDKVYRPLVPSSLGPNRPFLAELER